MKPRILFLLLTLLLPWPMSAQIVDEVPRQTALSWLALVDNGKYNESWKVASPLFQKAISQDGWVKTINQSRQAQGALEQRDFLRGRFMSDPPNMPKGEYFGFEFSAKYESAKLTELVVVMKDQTGLWQVANYSITTAAGSGTQ